MVVYNLQGQVVETLVDERYPAGRHVAQFNGAPLPSGVYMVHIQAGNFSARRKMLLVK